MEHIVCRQRAAVSSSWPRVVGTRGLCRAGSERTAGGGVWGAGRLGLAAGFRLGGSISKNNNKE